MALMQLYQISTSSQNPTGLVNLKPGGAGSQTTGTQITPGISAPTLEALRLEVLDTTAPSLITSGVTLATPAPAGKLLVLDPVNGAFGALWKLNSAIKQPLLGGQFGIVETAGQVSEAGTCVGSASGNVSGGARAVVITQGPVQAFVQGTVGGTTISAGMPLAADGAGNLTYAGASPSAGTVLAVHCDAAVSSSVSIPVLSNVYLGGY